jgi:cell division protein FtsN
MVMVLFLEVSESASSSNNNTYVVIGAVVSAVVVLVMVVLIVSWLFYRRMPKRESEGDNARNIQNPAYHDTQPDESRDEHAQQSSFMGAPVDANYQCLKTRDQMQPERSHHYENVRRCALLNMRNNSGNEVLEENVYEVMH